MVIVRENESNKCWQGYGESGTLYSVGRVVKWCSYCGKQHGCSSKNSK
jgi:hypothetical protein